MTLEIKRADTQEVKAVVSKLRIGEAIIGLDRLSKLLIIGSERLDDIIDGKDLPSEGEVDRVNLLLD